MPSELFEALPEDEMEVVIKCQKKSGTSLRGDFWEFIIQPKGYNSIEEVYHLSIKDDATPLMAGSEPQMKHFIRNWQSKLNETIQEFIEEEIFYETTKEMDSQQVNPPFNSNNTFQLNGNNNQL
jgi:hypothetical protein